jgi:hypothetical protein
LAVEHGDQNHSDKKADLDQQQAAVRRAYQRRHTTGEHISIDHTGHEQGQDAADAEDRKAARGFRRDRN